jgi:class 3 adenylate cyclase
VVLHTYIPQDRLRALACGQTLPDRTAGSALFADISGFTALTESLREALGSRQGAEELTKHLGIVYSALIAKVEKHDGSVISFAGDAVTCWFDGGEAAMSSVTCAFDLQTAMLAFSAIALPNGKTTSLSLKVCVATGHARRFVVGDPEINYIDALAGATVARTCTGEHLASKGEILVDEATEKALGDCLSAQEWRTAESGEKFAVARALSRRAQITNSPNLQLPEPDRLKAWIDRSVYEREYSSLSPACIARLSDERVDRDFEDVV